jgi:hypothetical protein
MTNEEEVEVEVTELRVYGNAITAILRTCYDNNDPEAVMGLIPGRTCGEILAVCKREADITGNDQDGFEFVYRDEPTVESDGGNVHLRNIPGSKS